MKGILGRKVGMTQLFTEHGRSLPVSIIEIKDNIVTSVFSKEKDGYNGVQLATFDKRDKVTKKPLLGHFKKAKTNGKRFVKEIKNMEGYNLGQILNASIFSIGEFVDVTGISKGKGFQGTIKRYNQKIGPKSHGGGGGSKPLRLTGSIGDIASNKVNKGMTMPGHMGAKQITIQNLEIISIDLKNNALIVRGSIPGPKKGFVIVKSSIKGILAKEPQKLVDMEIIQIKNQLLEEAKHYNAEVNTDMSVEKMREIIKLAKEDKEKVVEIEKSQSKNDEKETKKFENINEDIKVKENNEKVEKENNSTKKSSKEETDSKKQGSK